MTDMCTYFKDSLGYLLYLCALEPNCSLSENIILSSNFHLRSEAIFANLLF